MHSVGRRAKVSSLTTFDGCLSVSALGVGTGWVAREDSCRG